MSTRRLAQWTAVAGAVVWAIGAAGAGSVLAAVTPAQDPAVAPIVSPEVFEVLAESQQGRVYVVIALEQPQDLAARGVPPEQRSVEAIERRVLERVAPRDFEVVYRYRHFAGLTGWANAEGLRQLALAPGVVRIGLDEEGHALLSESGPFINADDVHADLGITGDGATVAILDTGVDTDHPDLQDSIVDTYHFLNQGGDVGPGAEDGNGHGTNVAGIVTSDGDNNIAPTGIAPGADIVVVQVLNANGNGWASDWAAGVDYVVDLTSDVGSGSIPSLYAINMSLGTNWTSADCPCDNSNNEAWFINLRNAIDTAAQGGIVTFAASGNLGLCPNMPAPACLRRAYSVGAVYDQNYGREPDSGTYRGLYGSGFADCFDSSANADTLACFTNRNDCLDVLAPGRLITSTGLNGGTSTYTGTSQATPHVAATAALMYENHQPAAKLPPVQLVNTIKNTGVNDPVDLYCYSQVIQVPRVDALAATNAVEPPFPQCFETISNGDFEMADFVPRGTSGPDDLVSDEVPGFWLRWETFSSGAESSGLSQANDNGPSAPGTRALHISRPDGDASGDWTAIVQNLNIKASDYAGLFLQLDVKVEWHDLEGGGWVDPAFEWPAVVEIRYLDTNGDLQIWRYGWYVDPPGDGDRIHDPGQGLIDEYRDEQVEPGVWTTTSFNLFNELPQVDTITQIRVGGSGWSYESYIDNVSLSACNLIVIPGDLDGDGDVDIGDFSTFAACYGGSGVPCEGDCCAADLDGDGDVDIADFSTFAGNFTGSR